MKSLNTSFEHSDSHDFNCVIGMQTLNIYDLRMKLLLYVLFIVYMCF